MKKIKYIWLLLLAPIFGLAVSCSDYEDWNTMQEDANPSAERTLWENITAEPQLSDFAKVLKKAGLEEQLSAAHYYTVWAPLNGTFDVDSVLNCSDNAILAQFINNHIAEYNHLAKGNLYEKVKTLNRKSYEFMFDEGNYTYNTQLLVNNLYNLPSSNGTLHVINGNSEFLPNGLEALSMIEGIDSISTYILNYNDTTLDTRNSVPGPVVNGKQTYLDSVFTTSNTLTSRLRARIESEDSTYSILLPTDKAYDSYYTNVKSFYKFLDGLKWQNVHEAAASTYTTQTITASTIGVNFSFLADSLAKRQIVDNLFYSNNNKYNMHLVKEDAENYNDTVQTTMRVKYSNGDEIFNDYLLQTERLSNGFAFVVDSLAFKPWETYNPEIKIQGTNPCRYINYLNYSNVRVPEEYVNTSLVELEPGQNLTYCHAGATSRGKPEVDYYISGLKATTYNIYVVIPPANVDLRDSITEVRPNILNFSYNGYYVDANGRTQYTNTDMVFTNERYDGEKIVEGSTTKLTDTDFVNDTSKVDTMYLGQLTLPYCYAGLGYYPNIKVTNSARINLFRPAILDNYTRDIRICSFLFRPLDYEAYLDEENNVKSKKTTKK